MNMDFDSILRFLQRLLINKQSTQAKQWGQGLDFSKSQLAQQGNQFGQTMASRNQWSALAQQLKEAEANANAGFENRKLGINQQRADLEMSRYSAPEIIKQKDGSVISVDNKGHVTPLVGPIETPQKMVSIHTKDASGSTVTEQIPRSQYSDFLKASRSWADNMPKETIEVPGKLWGKNTIPNPAFSDYQKTQPGLNDFLDSNSTQSQADTAWAARNAPRMTPPASVAPGEAATNVPAVQKVMTPDIAAEYMKKAKTRSEAEKMAQQDGYSW